MQYNRIEYKRKVLTLKFKIKVNLRQKFPPCASLFSTWEWRFPIGDSRNGNVKKCPRKSGEYERRELREMMGLTMSLAVRSDCQATCYFRRFVKIWWGIGSDRETKRQTKERGGKNRNHGKNTSRLGEIGENREFHRQKCRVVEHLEVESLMALLKAAAHHLDMVLNTYATDSWMIALSSLSHSVDSPPPRCISAGNLVTGHRFLHLLWPRPVHRSPDAEKTRERTDRERIFR